MECFKRSISIFLCWILILQSSHILSVYASDYKEIKFDQVVDINNNLINSPGDLLSSQTPSSLWDMWRYSGGYWQYTNKGTTVTITDSEARNIIRTGMFNKIVDFEESLPEEVRKFLAADPNNINKLQIKITSGNKNHKEIYSSSQWKIENGKIFIKTNVKFNFQSNETITQRFYDKGMAIAIPVVNPDYGSNIYAIYSKNTGERLGAAEKLENILKDSNGNLDPYKPVYIIAGPQANKSFQSQNVKVGDGTFSSGGATGFRFKFPLKVEYYIPADVNVKVIHTLESGKILDQKEYITQKGTSIAEKANDYPDYPLIYSIYSNDGGKTWKDKRSREETTVRNISATTNIIIKFVYGEGQITADLVLKANPGAIEKGKTATVDFTMDATGSISKYNIDKYEFWFAEYDKEFNSKPDFTGPKGIQIKTVSNVAPKTRWKAKVKVYDNKLNKSAEAYADVEIEEIIPQPVDDSWANAHMLITSFDEKTVERDPWYPLLSHYIKVKLPYEVYKNREKFDLNVTLNASYAQSKHGIAQYEFFLYNDNSTEISSSPVVEHTIEGMTSYNTGITGKIKVTDAVSGVTDEFATMIDVIYVVDRIPPRVNLSINRQSFFYGETAILTPTFFEHEIETYPISRKEWKITNSAGEVMLEGEGNIQKNVLLEWPTDNYKAEQTIYYIDDYGVEGSATATVNFKVVIPEPVADIKAYMLMDNNGTWEDITNTDKGKVYKKIKLDISSSVEATDSYVNQVYPIDFTSPRTQFKIVPVTATGEFDASRADCIYTYIASELTKEDDRITFSGKKSQVIRIDKAGRYKISAKVFNRIFDSEWATAYITIRPDLPPTITKFQISGAEFDYEKEMYIDYREPDNQLKTTFVVDMDFESLDEDYIDESSIKLEIRHDYNNDNDTGNDGDYSKMFVKKFTEQLQSYVKVAKSDDMKNFQITIDNPMKNIFGKFRFEGFVSETPKIPNFIGGDLPSIPTNTGNTYGFPMQEKLLYIDNKKPNIRIIMGKQVVVEVLVIDLTDDVTITPQMLKQHYGDDAKIYYINENGDKVLYE